MRTGGHNISLLVAIFVIGVFPSLTLAETETVDCAKAEKYVNEIAPLMHKLDLRRMAYTRAVKLCPKKIAYRRKLVDLLEKMVMMARKDLNSGANISGKDFVEMVEWKDQLLDSAEVQFEELAKLDPTNYEVWLGLARIYFLQGRYQKAKSACERALRHAPADKGLRKAIDGLKAQFQEGAGDIRRSEDILAQFKKASVSTASKYMGFKDTTAVGVVLNNRQRFSNILFAENSSSVNNPKAVNQLKEIGKALRSKSLKGYKFVVEGHTDNRGEPKKNKRLSKARAEAVKSYLVKEYDIIPDRIVTQGFGLQRPRVPNDSPKNWKLNRRVEIEFLGTANKRME